MAAETMPDDVMINSKLQAPLSPIEKSRKRMFGTTDYRPEFADAVFELLTTSKTVKTKSHCCAFLQCSKPTLLSWMKKYPEFGKAIDEGLEIGKSNWYTKLYQHAFEPSQKVNNGLIKLLSANIYGIKDEPPVTIINSNQQNVDSRTPEEIMKERNIPIPSIDIEDIDTIDEQEE